jgi:CheY-like chemotaxis protein
MKTNGGAPRILVVEDEPLTALALTEAVASLGAEVVGPAWSVKNATALAHEERIDGAVLDIKLQDSTAYGLAAQLTNRNIPVVFVTAYARDAVPRAFRGLPCVHKPFCLGELEAALGRAFGLHERRRRRDVSFSHLR